MRPFRLIRQGARLVALLGAVAVAALYATREAPMRERVAPGLARVGRSSVGGTLELGAALARREQILARIAESDTYIPASLAAGDSMLRRWPERVDRPITVYLADGHDVPGVSEAHGQAVRDAFGRWQRVASIPVQFLFVRDSGRAEVRVRWIEAFDIRRAGQADVVWDRDGWLIKASLTLATHTHEGRHLSPEAVYTVALHEIGHLLGLGHSDSPDDVMYPTTSVHDLTFRDRHTARLLYTLPPGSLRAPAPTR